MPDGPIQVVLNTQNFRVSRERPAMGSNKDFFAGHDVEFEEHRKQLLDEIGGLKSALESQSGTQIGVAKVTLLSSAIAKSHRPVHALFKPDRTPMVGAQDFGSLLFRVSPRSLESVAGAIISAEAETRWKEQKSSKKLVASPSRQRSESGAIERIELFGPADRRGFSTIQAIDWLRDPKTGGAYHVDLFHRLTPREAWDTLEEDDLVLQRTFLEGIEALGLALRIHPVSKAGNSRPTLFVRLEPRGSQSTIHFNPLVRSGRPREASPGVSSDAEEHEKLLRFFDWHPLVRAVRLPGVLRATEERESSRGGMTSLPKRMEGVSYPKVGVVDGGISGVLSEWVVGAFNLLAERDRELDHGTFIGGLLVAGEPLNGLEVVLEPGPCDLVDVSILPTKIRPKAFSEYFPNGVSDFLDEVEAAISECRARFGVRIFNFSLNLDRAVTSERYSEEAARLDQISDEHDVIIFISAGNLLQSRLRSEWVADPLTAMSHLVAARDDGIHVPAETVRNITVGAINPPGLEGAIAHAPASYTRRGPGPGAVVKPDLVHVGGNGRRLGLQGHGLFSIDPGGYAISSRGTSYATPLVAKAAAILSESIEGIISRETLKALLIHFAEVPAPVKPKAFDSVARHLVGFGLPGSVADILEGDPHRITLVFSNRLERGQDLVFPFQWPQCLVKPNGKCIGDVKATLVYSPPLDYRYGAEFVRVNLEAAVRQEGDDGRFEGEVPPAYLPEKSSPHLESKLIEHGLKWSPIKVYRRHAKIGVGASSNWRLVIEYLERAESRMPVDGVPFSCILTITDPNGDQPVFNDMRQSLQSIGVQLENIRTAARILPRV